MFNVSLLSTYILYILCIDYSVNNLNEVYEMYNLFACCLSTLQS